MALIARTVDNKDRSVRCDDQGRFVTADAAHDAVHEGQFFTTCNIFTDVTSASYAELLLINGTTKKLHAILGVIAEGKAAVSLFEGGTVTANGSSISVINMNRASSNTSTAVAFTNPTFSTTGTLISNILIPGGVATPQTRFTVGGDIRQESEWILNTGEKYNLSVLNSRGTVSTIDLQVQFYEAD